MLRGVLHFSFTVSDLERSKRFYGDVLDFDLVHEQEQDNDYTRTLVGYEDAHLRVALFAIPGQPRGHSSHDLELIEYVRPRGSRGCAGTHHPGAAHLALMVDDIHERYKQLASLGVSFVSPPVSILEGLNMGGAACYLRDPDEISIELLQPPPHVLGDLTSSDSQPAAR